MKEKIEKYQILKWIHRFETDSHDALRAKVILLVHCFWCWCRRTNVTFHFITGRYIVRYIFIIASIFIPVGRKKKKKGLCKFSWSTVAKCIISKKSNWNFSISPRKTSISLSKKTNNNNPNVNAIYDLIDGPLFSHRIAIFLGDFNIFVVHHLQNKYN